MLIGMSIECQIAMGFSMSPVSLALRSEVIFLAWWSSFTLLIWSRVIAEPYFQEKGIDYDAMMETCCLVLAWERFFMDGQKRKDLLNAEQATWDLQLYVS
jgi:hypothetical protein